jgi:hypothetical protein
MMIKAFLRDLVILGMRNSYIQIFVLIFSRFLLMEQQFLTFMPVTVLLVTMPMEYSQLALQRRSTMQSWLLDMVLRME